MKEYLGTPTRTRRAFRRAVAVFRPFRHKVCAVVPSLSTVVISLVCVKCVFNVCVCDVAATTPPPAATAAHRCVRQTFAVFAGFLCTVWVPSVLSVKPLPRALVSQCCSNKYAPDTETTDTAPLSPPRRQRPFLLLDCFAVLR